MIYSCSSWPSPFAVFLFLPFLSYKCLEMFQITLHLAITIILLLVCHPPHQFDLLCLFLNLIITLQNNLLNCFPNSSHAFFLCYYSLYLIASISVYLIIIIIFIQHIFFPKYFLILYAFFNFFISLGCSVIVTINFVMSTNFC